MAVVQKHRLYVKHMFVWEKYAHTVGSSYTGWLLVAMFAVEASGWAPAVQDNFLTTLTAFPTLQQMGLWLTNKA